MSATKKAVLATALSLAVVAAIFEAIVLVNQHGRVADSESVAHQLLAESATLQLEFSHMQKSAQEEAALSQISPASADSLTTRLHSIVDDVKILQRAFALLPEERIPELRFLTESDWMAVAVQYDLKDRAPIRLDEALCQVRNKARVRFNPLLRSALNKYLIDSHDSLPATPLALLPYFEPPVDAAVLSRYEMVRTGTATEAGPRATIIREKKSPADGVLDTLSETAILDTHFTYAKNNRESRLTSELKAAIGLAKPPTVDDSHRE